jgi:hypothetical protein
MFKRDASPGLPNGIMPTIPDGYDASIIDSSYHPFLVNDGMVPLTSALFLNPGAGSLFHINKNKLEYDKTALASFCQVAECHVINEKVDHLDFLNNKKIIQDVLLKLIHF